MIQMNKQTQFLADLCRQYQIAILYVFGSQAKDVQGWIDGVTAVLPASTADVDIGVKLQHGKTVSIQDKVQLTLALEDFFDVPRVDLVIFTDADPFLAANIVRGERLYAHDNHQADEFDLYILRRAGDLAPLELERIALILGEPI